MGPVAKLTSLLFVAAIGGATGYAAAAMATADRTGADQVESLQMVSAGQFTVPVFSEGRVDFVLLAQIHVETRTADQLATLSRSRPRLRSAILETLFALEREGRLHPGVLNPVEVTAEIERDLEATFAVGDLPAVVAERLLLQETSRSRSPAEPADS
jgi:hypothetical protein